MSYSIQVGDTEIGVTSVVNSVSVYNIYCNVVRMTKVNSAMGIGETPITIVTSMPCHIKWLRGQENKLLKKETHLLSAILHCRKPAGVTIKTTDQIYYNSEYYRIVDVIDFRNLGTLLEIKIEKIK